jgi:hypothetical protein
MREGELNIGFTMKGNNILRSNTGDNMLLLGSEGIGRKNNIWKEGQ